MIVNICPLADAANNHLFADATSRDLIVGSIATSRDLIAGSMSLSWFPWSSHGTTQKSCTIGTTQKSGTIGATQKCWTIGMTQNNHAIEMSAGDVQ